MTAFAMARILEINGPGGVQLDIQKLIKAIPSKSLAERHQMRSNAEKMAAQGSAEARELLTALDQYETAERNELAERARNLPKSQLVREAFSGKPINETEGKIVQVLLDNPGFTSEGLSKALGWGGQSWHMHFGTMCEKRLHHLWPAPPSDNRNAEFYSGILADLSPGTNRWTMKPEAAEGFAALGLHPSEPTPR